VTFWQVIFGAVVFVLAAVVELVLVVVFVVVLVAVGAELVVEFEHTSEVMLK
jgi:hypothetical protein